MNFKKRFSIFKELETFFTDFSHITSLSYKLFFIAITTGIVVGFAAVIFNFILDLFLEGVDHLILILPSPYFIIFIPAIGGLIAGLIRYFSKTPFDMACATDAAIETIQKHDGHVDTMVPIAGILSASVTIASGGSCGRECPTAFIGTGFASITARIIKKLKLDKFFGVQLTKQNERMMGICGAAAGIGAIFRAPIGAAIFSTEVLYKYGFEFTAILPALISATIGFTLFTMFYSYEALFSMEAVWEFGFSTILFAVIVSIIGSVIGGFYVKIFNSVFKYSRKVNIPDWLKPAIGGLIHGLLVFFVARELWGMGYDSIQNAIDGNLSIVLMLILLFGKIFSTSFTIATGGSGGVIAPSLFIGAMLGGILGKLFGAVFATSTPIGVYVAIGMVSLYSSVGKVPLSLPLLIMEATRNISLMLPLFIASAIGYILSGRNTIYEVQPERIDYGKIGLNILGETEGDMVDSYQVKDIMRNDNSAIPLYEDLQNIAKFIQESVEPFYPVVDSIYGFIGEISLSEIKHIFLPDHFHKLVTASDLVSEASSPVTLNSSVKNTLMMFNASQSDYIPVVESESSNKFMGVIIKADVMSLLKREMVSRAIKVGTFDKHKTHHLSKHHTGANGLKNSNHALNNIYSQLDWQNIILELKSKNIEDVIVETVDLLNNNGVIENKKAIIDLLIDRESETSTGIGHGIALPHVRTDKVSNVVFAFGKSEKGIALNSMDGEPAHLLFLVLTPSNQGNIMLKIMRTLSKTLKSEKNRLALIEAKTVDEVLELFKGF